ncbi:glucosaminidase domain-containing protein [Desulfobotulus sp. H1]|uniref:Glucosaminidase domain-containing protein n=1 Tax=Desulfobotulus pelophilus TaxID=2823377 RepID=A0ABT3NBT3_9BACT|nr:glucosaminidase domain-containing protein [Desulfobotulus pelophilus]MCW7754636.1 glucosaminidase domain-containing protein [Desulfobotulus pelophilus]
MKKKAFLIPGAAFLSILMGLAVLSVYERRKAGEDFRPEIIIGRVALPDLSLYQGGESLEVLFAREGLGSMQDSRSPLPPSAGEISLELPDFSAYTDVKEKKKAFFQFLRPIVEQENWAVLKERARVLVLWQQFQENRTLSEKGLEQLETLRDRYRVEAAPEEGAAFFREMLMRIDAVPVPLALIQAAKESGWGSSHFAREGNNLFGQWCFEKGCGMVPRMRPEGAIHEVQIFGDVAEAVRAYLWNLNTHSAYEEVRMRRYRMRMEKKELDGRFLAGGLEKYSERGMEYVRILRRMIRANESFMGFDRPDV